MEKPERLKTIELDVEKSVLKINGRDVNIKNTTSLVITVEAGYVRLNTSHSCFGKVGEQDD